MLIVNVVCNTASRVGAVAHCTVLRAVLRKYRKWLISDPHRIKILEPIKTEIGTVNNVIKITKYAKFGQDQSSDRVSSYG